jgi:hypothetical protein
VILLAGVLPLAAQTGYSIRSDGNDRQDDFLFAIDLKTGVATPIGPTGFEDVEGLTFDRACKNLFGVDDVTDRLLSCDTETGACHQVGNLGVDITDTGLAYGSDLQLYMSTDAPKNPTLLYRIDPATGAATAVGDQGQEVTGLAANTTGIFGLGGDGRNNLVRINPVTGAATSIGPLKAVAPRDGGLDFDADGVLWGIEDSGLRNASRIFTVDPETGTATVVATVHLENGTALGGFESLAVKEGVCSVVFQGSAPQAIPAAGGWGLAALAFLLTGTGLFVLRRMR